MIQWKKWVRACVMGISISSAVMINDLQAQDIHQLLYEQASETSGLVIQYSNDVRAIQTYYGASAGGGRFGGGGGSANSPEQNARLVKLDKEYLAKLDKLDFNRMSVHGQVDYILLKKNITASLKGLEEDAALYKNVQSYFPFAETIYAFEQKRRRGTTVDAEEIAGNLHKALLSLQEMTPTIQKIDKMDLETATYAARVAAALKTRLTNAFSFYNGYDPLFSWWVPAPYEALSAELTTYEKLLRSKGEAPKVFDDGSNIGGKPVGRETLNRLLKEEMVAYTAEELLKLADQEFAWCEAELLKASREMGFGDNWKAAQEKVKNSYVVPGKQPELILQLNDDAINFIAEHDLMDMPEIALETWGMIMMTPERQLINPFFTGGREISISYPTNTMSHEQKLMSMRGNNPYFSRGTVQHELNPGHHLQYHMNSRYKPYRQQAFNTMFSTEGWTLYWELLLYAKGFPKTPEERIGMLFWRMHRCARITFSINFHLGKWTPQECIDFLVDRVGHEPANAHAEVKRSFEAAPPLYQLAYLVGGLQMYSISKELVDSGKMTYKEFHEAVIKENHLPMELLRATLKNEKLSKNFESSWKFYQFN